LRRTAVTLAAEDGVKFNQARALFGWAELDQEMYSKTYIRGGDTDELAHAMQRIESAAFSIKPDDPPPGSRASDTLECLECGHAVSTAGSVPVGGGVLCPACIGTVVTRAVSFQLEQRAS
jgi:formylmethanofuran dehydrogenase subunit E